MIKKEEFEKSREDMCQAFCSLYPEHASDIQYPNVGDMLATIPLRLASFQGRLDNETVKQASRRKECAEVYDGEIKALANNIRNTYPEHRALSAQQLLLKVYFDNFPEHFPEDAKNYEVPELFDDFDQEDFDRVRSQDPPTPEVTTKTSSDDKTTINNVSTEVETEEPAVDNNVVVNVESDNSNMGATDEASGAKLTETSVAEKASTSGTAVVSENKPSEEIKPTMEEKVNMAEVSIAEKISQATGALNAGATAPKAANVSKVDKAAKKASENSVLAKFQGTAAERAKWTAENQIEKIICTKKPNGLLVAENFGVIALDKTNKDGQTTTAGSQIEAMLNNFIEKMSGKKISRDEFDKLPDAEKYARAIKLDKQIASKLKAGETVTGPSNEAKAKAIYGELLKAIQDPAKKFPILPADRISYPEKGVVIGGKPITDSELIMELIDKGAAKAYGKGSLSADGKTLEGASEWSIGLVQKKAANKTGTQAAAASRATKTPRIRVKNKAAFTKDESNVMYLFTQQSNAVAKAKFPVAITIDGVQYPARVSGLTDEEVKKNAETGVVTYKRTSFSLSGITEVPTFKKEFAAAFVNGDEAIALTCSRWGVSVAQKKETNVAKLTDLSGSDWLKIATAFYDGEFSMDNADSSTVLNALAQARRERDAKAAAQTAAEMDQ